MEMDPKWCLACALVVAAVAVVIVVAVVAVYAAGALITFSAPLHRTHLGRGPDLLRVLGASPTQNGQFSAAWIRPATEWATADRSSRPDGRPVQVCRRLRAQL